MLLLEAAHRLAKSGIDFELVLCGDGEQRREIQAFLENNNLQSRVCLLGWINDEQIRNEILRARGLVLPSFAEGLPVVIMEAMALGRPVISTFVAGIPELVESGKSGWLVPAGDVDTLMEAMQTCLGADVDTLFRMGKAARFRALSRHNVNTEAGRLVALFEGAKSSVAAK
jgi:glycosyltransferase involved in cell wall biosynthesis